MDPWKIAGFKSDAQNNFLVGMRQPLQKDPEGAQWEHCSREAPRGSLHFDISLNLIFRYLKMTPCLLPKSDKKKKNAKGSVTYVAKDHS